MEEYRITKTAKTCTKCGKTFTENEGFFSVVADDRENLERRDYCEPCWTMLPPAGKDGFFSFWKTVLRPKARPKHRALDMETAKDFFLKLHGTGDPAKEKFLYILTLMLLRKRALVHEKSVREDGNEIMVLHFPKEETLYHVREPEIDEAGVDVVKRNFTELFDAEI